MIVHIIKESSIDYPGKIGPIIFTSGCNFNCGFCHNARLNKKDEGVFLDEDKIINEIREKALSGWYNGVCISGGEPLIYGEKLKNFILKLKSLGLKIKIDTNGTNPKFLKELVQDGLIDYIAMDIKGPKRLYDKITGVSVKILDIEESIKFLLTLDTEKSDFSVCQELPKSSLHKTNFEFRTTIPLIDDENFRFMNEQETNEMGKWIFSLAEKKDFNWNLQAFVSRTKEDMNNEKMSLESLPKAMHETPKEHLEKLKIVLDNYCDNVEIR